jgi:hypothetical protein
MSFDIDQSILFLRKNFGPDLNSAFRYYLTTFFPITFLYYYYYYYYYYSALGPVWQEPEPSQMTGMALVHCILG